MCARGIWSAVTRDDLVGQYIGHTAPKTKDVLKKAMGGVLFIDEAYYLYRPDNERDYGQEAIEILLQVMENNRDDLVVILAGYADRMDKLLFQSNPGFRSRIAHHIEFPDYHGRRIGPILPTHMLEEQSYVLTGGAQAALADYIALRRGQPHFANARSIRNALDRARLRQANRLFSQRRGRWMREALSTIEEADIRASRVFRGGLDAERKGGAAMTFTRTDQDRPVDPVRRFRRISAARCEAIEAAGRRLGACRCDGRAFRAEHHLRPARRAPPSARMSRR